MNDLINQQRERIAELEEQLKTATASWNYEAGECAKAEQRAESAEQRVKELENLNNRLEKALAITADELFLSISQVKEAKKAIGKIEVECVDVLFDFSAMRCQRGLKLPFDEQPQEIKGAINLFEQLRAKLGGE